MQESFVQEALPGVIQSFSDSLVEKRREDP